jgi:hypothetical protein
MRIDEILFFAPRVPFHTVDTGSPSLILHFCLRIEGYYLSPAVELASHRDAFPAGVLLVSAVDALARYDPRCTDPVTRYTDWLAREMPSFGDPLHARRFYNDFRCGLVHEARIKNGCEFSTAIRKTLHLEDGVMVINPQYFHAEAVSALASFSDYLGRDAGAFTTFRNRIRADFQHEFANNRSTQNAKPSDPADSESIH